MPSYRSSFARSNMTEIPTIGDLVECWLFNTPDARHYGEKWIGEVLSVDNSKKRSFLVTRPGYPNIEVSIKEIWEIVAKR